jgi:hypothetical protein
MSERLQSDLLIKDTAVAVYTELSQVLSLMLAWLETDMRMLLL